MASASSHATDWPPRSSKAASTVSDCNGSRVAEPNAERNSPAYAAQSVNTRTLPAPFASPLQSGKLTWDSRPEAGEAYPGRQGHFPGYPKRRQAMFIPGHLHLASASEVDRQAFDIHLRYRVLEAEARPVAVHFDMEGRIDGQPFSES